MVNEFPEITVVMPAYNAERYLEEAIRSILDQTFTNFEFLIVNDGSTDKTEEIVKQFNDPRISLLSLTENQGLVPCLNMGIEKAKGAFIARMDADDIAKPTRLEKQLNFLKENPDVGLCGTSFVTINGEKQTVRLETQHDEIIFKLLYQFHSLHPSWLFRKQLIEINNIRYRNSVGEDYFLLTELVPHAKIANLSSTLMLYRKHDSNISGKDADLRKERYRLAHRKIFEFLEVSDLTDNEIDFFERIMYFDYTGEGLFIQSADQLFAKIDSQLPEQSNYVNINVIRTRLHEQWYNCFRNSPDGGLTTMKAYLKSRLRNSDRSNFMSDLLIIAKCLLRPFSR